MIRDCEGGEIEFDACPRDDGGLENADEQIRSKGRKQGGSRNDNTLCCIPENSVNRDNIISYQSLSPRQWK